MTSGVSQGLTFKLLRQFHFVMVRLMRTLVISKWIKILVAKSECYRKIIKYIIEYYQVEQECSEN